MHDHFNHYQAEVDAMDLMQLLYENERINVGVGEYFTFVGIFWIAKSKKEPYILEFLSFNLLN